VDHRDVLDTASKRKISNPSRDSKPDLPIVQSVVSRYTDSGILALQNVYKLHAGTFFLVVQPEVYVLTVSLKYCHVVTIYQLTDAPTNHISVFYL
jgi:hypothetical protein